MNKGFLALLETSVLFGGDGYLTKGDVKYRTHDGINVNDLWEEFQDTLTIYNQHLGSLLSLLTYQVQSEVELVPRVGEVQFERATEYGVPKAARIEADYYQLAYDFKDYDLAFRYTWMYLRDADSRQVRAMHGRAMEADRALMFRKVMEAIFHNETRPAQINGQPYNVYPLYNGDGQIPPSYKGQTFSGTHSHYMVSGAAVFDSEDHEAAVANLEEHGYGFDTGTQIIALCHRAEINQVRTWAKGQDTQPGAGTAIAAYDFVPAPNQPPFILPNGQGLLGSLPPDFWRGLRVIGSYGDVLYIEEPTIPQGYILFLATGGAGALENLVGLREHKDPAWRGLRQLPGNQSGYPLVDSFYQRSFGTGIRQRGGGVVMQITANPSYTPPAKFTRTPGEFK